MMQNISVPSHFLGRWGYQRSSFLMKFCLGRFLLKKVMNIQKNDFSVGDLKSSRRFMFLWTITIEVICFWWNVSRGDGDGCPVLSLRIWALKGLLGRWWLPNHFPYEGFYVKLRFSAFPMECFEMTIETANWPAEEVMTLVIWTFHRRGCSTIASTKALAACCCFLQKANHIPAGVRFFVDNPWQCPVDFQFPPLQGWLLLLLPRPAAVRHESIRLPSENPYKGPFSRLHTPYKELHSSRCLLCICET